VDWNLSIRAELEGGRKQSKNHLVQEVALGSESNRNRREEMVEKLVKKSSKVHHLFDHSE